MRILKELPELTRAGIITQKTADKILDHYKNKSGSSTHRLLIVLGILGAILVGLGIILIIAHNWDGLPRSTKTFFAFLPLLIGQFFCGFSLIKKQNNILWRESSTAFLFFAVATSISLVSQVYNLPGSLSSFLLTWMLLCLPLLYLMNSSTASLLYIIGITCYAAEVYWSYPPGESYHYWILLLLALPHYYRLQKKKPESNFTIFHNWIIPLSLVVALGTLAERTEELMFIAYFSLFGLFYTIGNKNFFAHQKLRNNGYLIIGALGTLVLLLNLSFGAFWEKLRGTDLPLDEIIRAPEFYAASIISLLAGRALYKQYRSKSLIEIKPLAMVFLLFIIIFIIGIYTPISMVLINLLVLAIGILTLRDGAKQNHLGVLNLGLLIVTALVACRFFDTDLSFVIRGNMFLSVGVGFFVANYWMLKKRKTNEK